MDETPIPGNLIRFGNPSQDRKSAPFTTINGTATDPNAVTLIVHRPDGTRLAYGWPVAGVNGLMTKEADGRFYVEVALDQSGLWEFRLAGTGAVTGASEGVLRVDPQRVV